MNPFLVNLPGAGREVDASGEALMPEDLVAKFLSIFAGDELCIAQVVFLQLAEKLSRPDCEAVRLGIFSARAARRRAGLLIEAVHSSIQGRLQ